MTLLSLSLGGMAVKANAADPADSLHAPMAVEWKYTGVASPNNTAAPLVSDGVLYFASGTRIYALDAKTGARKWSYPDQTFLTSQALASPTLSAGILFVPTGDGLLSLDAATGKVKFPEFHVTNGGVVCKPAVADGGVFFASGGNMLYGISLTTGRPLKGYFGTGVKLPDSMAGDMVSRDGIIYFVTANQELHAVDVATGAQKWHLSLEGNGTTVTPTLGKNFLYLTNGSSLYCIGIGTGRTVWMLPAHENFTAPAAVDDSDNVYVVTANRYVYALDPQRKPLWKQPARLDYGVTAEPTCSDGLLMVGTTGGGVYALDSSTGELKWNYAIAPTSLNPFQVPQVNRTVAPVVSGESLYVLTDDGSLTAFSGSATDTIAPTVTDLAPMPGEYCNGRPPFIIQAKLQDFGSGLQASSVSLSLDGRPVAMVTTDELNNGKIGFTFDKDTGVLLYTIQDQGTGISSGLSDGHHTAVVTAKDWMGNTKEKSWIFTTGIDYPLEKVQADKQRNTGGGPRGGGGSGAGGSGAPGGKGGSSGG